MRLKRKWKQNLNSKRKSKRKKFKNRKVRGLEIKFKRVERLKIRENQKKIPGFRLKIFYFVKICESTYSNDQINYIEY